MSHAISEFDLGDGVRIRAEFKKLDGTAIDPQTVAVQYRTPAGVETMKTFGVDSEVQQEAPGIYFIDLNAS